MLYPFDAPSVVVEVVALVTLSVAAPMQLHTTPVDPHKPAETVSNVFDVNVMLSVPATAFTGVTTKMTFDGVVNAATLCIVTEVQPILVRTAYPVWAVISISSVVDEAENSTGPAVFAFVLSPPRQVIMSTWPAAEPAPITIASVSASVVVCEVVELVTATDVAPAHVHVTLVASAKLQRAFDAVSVIVLLARTACVGVRVKTICVRADSATSVGTRADPQPIFVLTE